MSYTSLGTMLVLSIVFSTRVALGFCGFYVAKADTQLFNKASKVALVRHDGKTVLTMANDYRGDPQEFALVVPVPTFLERDQIHVGERAVLDHLDAYSAPRLVEYFDENPCRLRLPSSLLGNLSGRLAAQAPAPAADKTLGVTVEARYTVGEYDIVILSAAESTGLETWLTQNGYHIPAGAARVLGSYIKQGVRFFVAKVNLKEQARLGFSYLRPLQIAFESPKFMLPIRLGTVNADGPQELYVFTLTRKGRVETTNYRTKAPTGMDLPVFIKSEFGDFYRTMFDQQVQKEDMRAVFLEYAWDMGWCDPCAADPLSADELRQLGVFWLTTSGPAPARVPGRPLPPQAQDVFLTRLHVRYDADHFPEDLTFQETADRTNFQGRYILRHPWQGTETCREAEQYQANLPRRWEQEARTLASLTGWNIQDIRKKMLSNGPPTDPQKWWRRLWKD